MSTEDVTWIGTEQDVQLVCGGEAGTHIRPATNLEVALRDELELAKRQADCDSALVALWDHLHPEPRMDGSCRVTRMRIPVELVHKVHKALGDATS